MRRLIALSAAILFLGLVATTAVAAPPTACTKIQSGGIVYQSGALVSQTITTGVNSYGYNYQAHMFSGSYFNAYAAGDNLPPYDGDDAAYLTANPTALSHWAWPYRNDELAMKWNDAWLSNLDCDGDGALDRHYGFSVYQGSGAWLTNHMKGTYTDANGDQNWGDFVKIVAAPTSAQDLGGFWSTSGGAEIGMSIWGEFAILQDVYNDSGTGDHGVAYLSPFSAGFGRYGPK